MYTPSDDILEKYADVLINFALGSGSGVKKGESVYIQIPQSAQAFLPFLYQTVLDAGCYPIVDLMPTYISKILYTQSSDEQLHRVPTNMLQGRVADIDHMVRIISHEDKKLLEDVAPDKILARQQAYDVYKKSLIEKEVAGEFTRTMGLFGTTSMAQEVSMSIEEYREQIISACFLRDLNPITRWEQTYQSLDMIKNHLNSLSVDYLHVTGADIDLKIGIGKHRKRLSGSGRNVPSFEVFISPDRRTTDGRIKFNQPLYIQGKMITGIELKFSGGLVVDSRATQYDEVLENLLAIGGMDKLGEFSLTDSRLSHITKFMGETLYDENVGGQFGNTHIALGNSFKQSYPGDPKTVTTEQWTERGFNESALHIDMVSTSDRTVVAIMTDGSQEIIYQHGTFTFFEVPEIEYNDI